MKNYNQIADEVFCRRDEYETVKIQKKRTLKRVVLPSVCACMAVLIGVGVYHFNLRDRDMNVSSETTKSESVSETAAENIIIINSESDLSEYRVNKRAFDWGYFDENDRVEMSSEEALEYYGINIFPDVPPDLTAPGGSSFSVAKRDGGTGEVYIDQNILMYMNDEQTREIHLEFSKGSLPFYCAGHFYDYCNKSVINGIEAAIIQDTNGDYRAEFFSGGVGFYLSTRGLTQEETVDVISSLAVSRTVCFGKGPHVSVNDYITLITSFPCESEEYELPENGKVVFTKPLQAAMDKYGDTAQYYVEIEIYRDGSEIDPSSQIVMSERNRLSSLGMEMGYSIYDDGQTETYTTFCNAEYGQLADFSASEVYGYVISLYDE